MHLASVDEARERLDAASRIVVLTGAGISTAAGIPDFRGPQGLWTQDPDAELVSTLSYYLEDEDVRRTAWQRRLAQATDHHQPTDAHRALVALEHQGRLSGVVTQNTDGLHLDAGHSPAVVHEIHGSARTCRCERCGHRQPMAQVLARVGAGEADPHCQQPEGRGTCDGILRATVVLFGEMLDPHVLQACVDAVERCDLLVAIGSTLAVNPAAALVPFAIGNGARVVIVNNAETEHDDLAHDVLRGDIQDLVPRLVR
ncbi:SIR2 family NAD-dependent protein deacylase [Aestuariimicrobium sp. T2.26MG-19.2B]|uniref:SIR2 family NAD-dependent protein deacylase n=1 Tax=Aestuariimicrobium sp. T2.26MG-19.2B TaxID=3040679 RepID=UPI002477AE92|nr:Sir2 family NAD-dependent protein deacetylase [Aestuariimicrobium sp. T2.26MG-19.2B]CAI9403906.1 NAD-dependent protein deacetylase [Aestuariimicrobium sp. T2.26MG-19.2B]